MAQKFIPHFFVGNSPGRWSGSIFVHPSTNPSGIFTIQLSWTMESQDARTEVPQLSLGSTHLNTQLNTL